MNSYQKKGTGIAAQEPDSCPFRPHRSQCFLKEISVGVLFIGENSVLYE